MQTLWDTLDTPSDTKTHFMWSVSQTDDPKKQAELYQDEVLAMFGKEPAVLYVCGEIAALQVFGCTAVPLLYEPLPP